MSDLPPITDPRKEITPVPPDQRPGCLQSLIDLLTGPPPVLVFSVVRPQDLLVLDFRLENLTVQPGDPPQLVRARKDRPARITVTFPPQHIAEEAFFESSGNLKYYVLVDSSLLSDLDQRQLGDLPAQLAKQYSLFTPAGPGVTVDISGEHWTVSDNNDVVYTIVKSPDPGGPPGKVRLEIFPSSPQQPPDPPVQARLAGPSYLIFDASDLQEPIDFTLEGLLAKLSELPLCLAPAAAPDPEESVDPQTPCLGAPQSDHTRIEAPFHLLISPTRAGRWVHSCQPMASLPTGRTELWHTRLAAREGNKLHDDQAWIRAIWVLDKETQRCLHMGDDYLQANAAPAHQNHPFRTSLDAADRFNLMHLTSNYKLSVTAAVRARRLMLSTLGAWLDLHGHWPVTEIPDGMGRALSVSEWRHRATMGRDHYVRVVYEGFLFPFGHRAALVKITERKFEEHQFAGEDSPPKEKVAYLRQRMFIVVREPEKEYGENPGWTTTDPLDTTQEGVPVDRYLPFRSVRITTLVTPNLDPPEKTDGPLPDSVPPSQSTFWPKVNDRPFQFHLRARDQGDQAIEFTAPLLFIALEAHTSENLTAISGAYNEKSWAFDDRRTRPLDGQCLAYVPAEEDEHGGTAFETQHITFGVLIPDNVQALIDDREPAFLPAMLKAQVFIPDLQYLAGHTDLASLRYAMVYLRNGWDEEKNSAKAFAELIQEDFQQTSIQLDFRDQADRSGALLTPNMEIEGLSRKLGPAYNPDGIFANLPTDMSPKLLGQFDLLRLLKDPSAPEMHTQVDPDGSLTYTVTWEDVSLASHESFDDQIGQARLKLKVTTLIPAGDQAPRTTVEAELTNFALSLLPNTEFLRLNFERLQFRAETGRPPDVVADLTNVEFKDPLAFVDALSRYIPNQGFSDPPALTVTEQGIAAGYSLALPDVAVGMFSLQHLTLGAALTLPFREQPPSVRFNFAERQSPFTLSVGPFGGGGFFALQLTTEGMQVLEMALEFGAVISVNFGVASGGLYAMGGVYFKLEEKEPGKGKEAALYGYFRLGGEVDVLGLISASIELYMALGYEDGKAVGRASITVEVEVCFFSTSVEISCERRFAGSSGDPTFEDVMAPYYVHRPTGQVLFVDQADRVFYFDPTQAAQAYLFDPATGDSTPQPASTFQGVKPYRPVAPPGNADRVDPWTEYCRAFAIVGG